MLSRFNKPRYAVPSQFLRVLYLVRVSDRYRSSFLGQSYGFQTRFRLVRGNQLIFKTVYLPFILVKNLYRHLRRYVVAIDCWTRRIFIGLH
jgi:hypothetical protein